MFAPLRLLVLTKNALFRRCGLASPTLASGIGDISAARDTLKAPVNRDHRFRLLTVTTAGYEGGQGYLRAANTRGNESPPFTAHLHIVAVSNTFRCRQRDLRLISANCSGWAIALEVVCFGRVWKCSVGVKSLDAHVRKLLLLTHASASSSWAAPGSGPHSGAAGWCPAAFPSARSVQGTALRHFINSKQTSSPSGCMINSWSLPGAALLKSGISFHVSTSRRSTGSASVLDPMVYPAGPPARLYNTRRFLARPRPPNPVYCAKPDGSALSRLRFTSGCPAP